MSRDFVIKDRGLTNQMEEISKHHGVQAVAQVPLTAFCELYNKNQEQKADIKSLQFHQKEVEAKESRVTEKISIKN